MENFPKKKNFFKANIHCPVDFFKKNQKTEPVPYQSAFEKLLYFKEVYSYFNIPANTKHDDPV